MWKEVKEEPDELEGPVLPLKNTGDRKRETWLDWMTHLIPPVMTPGNPLQLCPSHPPCTLRQGVPKMNETIFYRNTALSKAFVHPPAPALLLWAACGGSILAWDDSLASKKMNADIRHSWSSSQMQMHRWQCESQSSTLKHWTCRGGRKCRV